jgi:hypothetical protein
MGSRTRRRILFMLIGALLGLGFGALALAVVGKLTSAWALAVGGSVAGAMIGLLVSGNLEDGETARRARLLDRQRPLLDLDPEGPDLAPAELAAALSARVDTASEDSFPGSDPPAWGARPAIGEGTFERPYEYRCESCGECLREEALEVCLARATAHEMRAHHDGEAAGLEIERALLAKIIFLPDGAAGAARAGKPAG